MSETFFIYVLQTVSAGLFGGIAFFIKGIHTRLDESGRRINSLEVASAKSETENVTLFHRLDAIETKLDRLLEHRLK
jgi:hypothetical protein|tara:strand:+ start:290 stop:520 length:231 start_codon:yes stop_codon:yes gene_type:complete